MRDSTDEKPSTKKSIEKILKHGGNGKCKRLEYRLCQSGYLNKLREPTINEERLKWNYRKDGLVLFLGAGVSCESEIPSWNGLIQDVIRKRGFESCCDIKRMFPNILTQFDWAGHQIGNKRKFCELLYDALYGMPKFQELKRQLINVPKKLTDQKEWKGWPSVLQALRKNKTLEAVAELLIKDGPKGTRTKFRRNPQIHAVITVNADNLLEIYGLARTSGNCRVLTMVDRASVADHPHAIPIYHLHGSLDARGENFRDARWNLPDDLLPELVFRESEYYETIANPNRFVNYTPQSYFQRHNVVFVGTSLDDLNIRRWLYTSFRERVAQRTKYLCELYRGRYKDSAFEAELESRRHFWLRTRDDFSEKMMAAMELVMEKIGVEIIWFDSFEKVQSYLRELKDCSVIDEKFSMPSNIMESK